MKRFALILLIIATISISEVAAQTAEQKAKMKKIIEYARKGKFYGADTTLIILGDCLPFYKANKCEEKLREKERFGHFSMGERARLGDTHDFYYSVNSEYSAYDLPIADNNALRLTYRDTASNLVSAVSKTSLLFVKSRKSGKVSLFLRLSFVPDHNNWVAALSNRGVRDYFEYYFQVDEEGTGKICYPQGCDAWTDLWFEIAKNDSVFKQKPAPTMFYTLSPNEPKTLLREVDLNNNACTLIDTDGDGAADWIIVDEPGFGGGFTLCSKFSTFAL